MGSTSSTGGIFNIRRKEIVSTISRNALSPIPIIRIGLVPNLTARLILTVHIRNGAEDGDNAIGYIGALVIFAEEYSENGLNV